MSKITTLASGQITAVDTLTVALIETDTNPSVVIVRWPDKPTVLHPRRFPDAAATIARLFAEAHTALAAIKAGRRAVTGRRANLWILLVLVLFWLVFIGVIAWVWMVTPW
jgi:hypothetical protein